MSHSNTAWAVERTRRWINDGCDPRSENAPDWATLLSMSEDGLLEVHPLPPGSTPSIAVKLTALGEYEADRLEAFFERNPAAIQPQQAPNMA